MTFLKFMGLAVLVVVVVFVPKAIPHLFCAPDSSETYVNALFKAYQYKNVHLARVYFNTSAIQSKYTFEPPTIGTAKTSATS